MTPHQQVNPTSTSHQRAYSVMAVPSELEQHRFNKQQQQQNLIWYQEIYKKYGYEPNKHSRNPSYFGPYLLLQTLGEGEFAKVKAGVHVQTNQEVAIKLMRKDHIKHASLETKLEREISVLKSVRHPHIVQLFEVLTIKNYIGIVLQRAAGGELFDYILKHHYLQEVEAKRLFAQLISGVDYMHQQHIVHRDLKLENLLLSKDRDIIITDFGFANRFSVAREDLMATSCGSPCYAAPELVINDESHYVGTAVDIWSCGVILFAMLCGYLPFDDDPSNPQGANINVLYKYIISTPLEIPNHMSQEASHLLRQMLVPDPLNRCTMEEIKIHPWLADHTHLFSDNSSDARSIDSERIQDTQTVIRDPSCTTGDEDIPSLEVAINATTIQEEEEEEEEVVAPPTPPQPEMIPPPSFLQAKFFSTLQRHVSTNSPKPRPASALPFTTNSIKIPHRSQSVQRREASSDYTNRSSKHLDILPSVSEQTTVHMDGSTSKSIKSKGQKLIDWFKRKPTSQSTKFTPSRPKTSAPRFPLPDRPTSVLPNPVRAMAIGKPLGSYAADFNDAKLRSHRGAVDQDALTSKAPNEVIMAIRDSLNYMGIHTKHTTDFKVKCIRPMRKSVTPTPAARTRKISSAPFKAFFASSSSNLSRQQGNVFYGEQGIDNGDEVQFSVELSKIENLPGLYVVDIKRIRGNIWAFKYLYHTLLDLLDLSGHGVGYMAHRRVQEEEIAATADKKNRISCVTTSSSGSSMMMYDEPIALK